VTFSVVIPAFRAAETLPRAIESALRQTLPPAEVIVVDDCSPDDGALVAARYPVTCIRRLVNGGDGAAKNTGVRAASSEWIALLDADDAWEPNRLMAVRDFALANPGVELITSDALIEVDGEVTRNYYDPPRGPSWSDRDQRALILSHNFIFSHVAMPRRLWLGVNGMDESDRTTSADWPFWLRLLFSGARAGLVREPLARYRVLSGSLSDSESVDARTARAAMRTALELPGLTPHERKLARAQLALAEHRIERVDALRSVWEGTPNRAALARVALARDLGRRRRAEAALAVLLPGAARRRMRRHPDSVDRA
jgi:glycosyltransferase involved in cell wall biosynthesis